MKGIALLTFAASILLLGFVQKGREIYVAEPKEVVIASSPMPLLFTGDIMLGRYVETLAVQSGDELRSFRLISNFLKDHVTIANLEGPLPQRHVQTPNNGFSFSFSSSTPRVLKEGGITAVSLANNHMFDRGRAGWEHTKKVLDEEGISHFGGYAPTEADYFETSLGTTTVIVYGITMIATGWDEDQAVSVARKIRVEHPDAYLIAFLHWGNEYVTQNASQREFAHSLIDTGTDAIIGAHPHVVQGIETYKGKAIFYSLGNFIFDQYWREDLEKGYMVQLRLEKAKTVYDLIPVKQQRSIVSIATSTEAQNILSSISVQSDKSLQQMIMEGRIKLP